MEEGVYKSKNGQSRERRHVVLARLYFSGRGMCGRDTGAGGACHHSRDLHARPYPAKGPLPSASGHSLLAGAPAWTAWS